MVFLVISIVGFAFFYTSGTEDSIKLNQVRNFANKIISNAESVFFAGEPSKVSVTSYLPSGVQSVDIIENSLVFNISTNSGLTRIAYSSDVPISGTLSINEGVKVIEIIAVTNGVSINEKN